MQTGFARQGDDSCRCFLHGHASVDSHMFSAHIIGWIVLFSDAVTG